ncbi:Hypothetical protein Cp226_0023 [Corynebacterium pseudotuberculosis]|nr:Hypothetical protein Cp226_0023 [Corynebacterium pseudotuberculosis]
MGLNAAMRLMAKNEWLYRRGLGKSFGTRNTRVASHLWMGLLTYWEAFLGWKRAVEKPYECHNLLNCTPQQVSVEFPLTPARSSLCSLSQPRSLL